MVEDVFAISLSLTLTTETFDDAQSDDGNAEDRTLHVPFPVVCSVST